MILQVFLDLIFAVVGAIFKVLPAVPSISADVVSGINNYVDLIISHGAPLFYFFVPQADFQGAVTIFLAVFLFDIGYHILFWFLQKIPFLNIH